MASLRALGLLLGSVALVACTRTNPAFGQEAGGSSDQGTLDGAEVSSSSTVGADGPGSGGGSNGSTTASSEDTGPTDCPMLPVDTVSYGRCGGCTGTCLQAQSGPPVIFDMVVCATDCQSACDCPAPNSGTALPACADVGCVLDCAEGRVCPEGMTCDGTTGRCMWNEAYGPCDDTCSSGHCLYIPTTASICPVLDCHVGEVFDASLCPPPPGGTVAPTCYAPDDPELVGQGWCVLPCELGQMCPAGMECMQGWCLHPV